MDWEGRNGPRWLGGSENVHGLECGHQDSNSSPVKLNLDVEAEWMIESGGPLAGPQ